MARVQLPFRPVPETAPGSQPPDRREFSCAPSSEPLGSSPGPRWRRGSPVAGSSGSRAVAGAQTGGDRPPADADRPRGGHGPGLDAAAQALNLSVDDLRSKLEGEK